MLICEKKNHGALCNDCKHGVSHERLPTCIGERCLSYAIEFANKNRSCSLCTLKEECLYYNSDNEIDLLKLGEECSEYRKLVIYTKCINVD